MNMRGSFQAFGPRLKYAWPILLQDVCHTWQSSQKTRWRWPSHHTGDIVLSLCDRSVSSDIPVSACPRSENQKKEKRKGKMSAAEGHVGRVRDFQKDAYMGHAKNGPFSQQCPCAVHAPFPYCCAEHCAYRKPFSCSLGVRQPPPITIRQICFSSHHPWLRFIIFSSSQARQINGTHN